MFEYLYHVFSQAQTWDFETSGTLWLLTEFGRCVVAQYAKITLHFLLFQISGAIIR